MLSRASQRVARGARLASTLVLAEHSNAALTASSLSAISAARKLGNDVTVLVAGTNCGGAATAAAAVDGVSRVLHADAACLSGGIAENMTQLLLGIQDSKSEEPYTELLLRGRRP
jgi:electron transfer flavoprotein alpha subunit